MSTVRSPNYPQMDLGDALEAIRAAYLAEHRNKMSREVLAKHLGYSSLNGRALAKIGAVRAYGLIEGTQDELRVTQDAITCLEAPSDAPERAEAMARSASKPPIFRDIQAEFSTLPSEHNLRFFLIKRGYTSDAAGKAAQTYLSTMRLVGDSGGSYNSTTEDSVVDALEAEPQTATAPAGRSATSSPTPQGPQAGQGMRQAIFTLEDGDVFLTFPANLSSDGYAELGEYLEVFLRRAQRSKRIEEAQDDFKDASPQRC